MATAHAEGRGSDGGGGNSVICGDVRQHLGTTIAFGLDNRDGATSVAKRACC